MTSDQHLVKSYDQELQLLNTTLAEMGRMAGTQLSAALGVLAEPDKDLAREVSARDARVDELDREVENQTVRLLALRQPMANDLRRVISAMRVSVDLERIADYAASVARRSGKLRTSVPEFARAGIMEMGQILLAMLEEAMRCYLEPDVEGADAVWRRDDAVDAIYMRVLKSLRKEMVARPESVKASTHLLFICKSLERVGDHLTNICEHTRFLATGKIPGPRRQTAPPAAPQPQAEVVDLREQIEVRKPV